MASTALRILVISNLPPHVLGGAENQVARLVEAWLVSGAEVTVAGHRIPDGEQFLGNLRVRTHHIYTGEAGGRFRRAANYFTSLAKLLLRHRNDFDVVYCRGLGDGAVSLAILSALGLCRLPIVAVPINARGTGDAFFLRSIPGWRFICKLIDKHVRAINLINPSIARDLDELNIRRPQRTHIPNGVPILAPIPRLPPPPVRRLAWTGRMEPQKGLDLLLPALARLHHAGARFELFLLGDGPKRPELESQASILGIGSCVHFIGAMASADIRDFLKNADIFVLPSRYEGMSNSALEAMEAGLPVLCTRCGGVDSAIENKNAGWVCRPGDPESLARALEEMLSANSDDLLARGRRSREQVENLFAIELRAADNLALLEKIAHSEASGR